MSENVNECGCKLVRVSTGLHMVECPLHATAPELLEWIKTLENDNGVIPDWLWKQRAKLIGKAEGEI